MQDYVYRYSSQAISVFSKIIISLDTLWCLIVIPVSSPLIHRQLIFDLFSIQDILIPNPTQILTLLKNSTQDKRIVCINVFFLTLQYTKKSRPYILWSQNKQYIAFFFFFFFIFLIYVTAYIQISIFFSGQ